MTVHRFYTAEYKASELWTKIEPLDDAQRRFVLTSADAMAEALKNEKK